MLTRTCHEIAHLLVEAGDDKDLGDKNGSMRKLQACFWKLEQRRTDQRIDHVDRTREGADRDLATEG